MLVCDWLKGLPDVVSGVWVKTIVQTCIVHLLRNSFKYASKRDWGVIAKDLKPVYTAASEAKRLTGSPSSPGGERHPAIIRLGERLGRIRAIPGLRPGNKNRHLHHQRHRIHQRPATAAVNARGHFPTEQAALKCLYMRS